MKIVVLDGHALNPGDLSWNGVKALGDCTVHDRTPADQTVERAQGAEVALSNKVLMDDAVMAQLPDLKYIGVLATGYNVIDVAAARARGIPVCNVPTYGTQSVAQMVFAHVLNLAQHVAHHAQTVKDGRWASCVDFCYWDFPLVELMDLTMGIVGFGRIGQAVGKLARAFGMKVIAHDVVAKPEDHPEVEFVSVDDLFRRGDVVTCHCPLTPETAGMVNAERLALMKPTAFLVNTSRGPVIVEQDLADALNAGKLAGAGLDVLGVEPVQPDNPLLTAKNCFVTPHIAWATRSARARLMDTVVENIKAFIDGSPQNVVN